MFRDKVGAHKAPMISGKPVDYSEAELEIVPQKCIKVFKPPERSGQKEGRANLTLIKSVTGFESCAYWESS